MFFRLLLSVGFCCLSILAFIACHEESPYVYSCQDGPVNFELFNEDLNPGAYLNHVGTTKLDYNIIQDESDMYEKLYIIYLRKKVDFKTNSLIVISVNGGGKTYVVNQTVEANCDKHKLIINATMTCGICTDDGVSYVFVIVPKIPSNTTIDFFPTYIN
jgi:hypothetical protein